MAQLNCIVVTPEKTALETKADFVALPLYDGEIGIAPAHSPLIGRLGYGELRVRIGDKVSRYYLDGGFVQVANDIVSILTERAVPGGEVDADVAQEQMDTAMAGKANTDDLLETRDRLVQQARAQLQVARRSR